MTKTKVLVLLCFCVAFAAGVAVGTTLRDVPPRPRPDSWLVRELNLTPEQREQMRQIWSGVAGEPRESPRQQREALQKERDETIQALLTAEQKAQYAAAMQQYELKIAALDAERRKAFDEAVERTKQILTDQQKAKYETMLKGRPGPHRRPGRPGVEMGARDTDAAAAPHRGE